MEKIMKRSVCGWVCLALVTGLACKATPDDPLSKGLAAIGGSEAVMATKTLLVKGTVKQWEPEQSLVADGEPRFANESTFTRLLDFGAGVSRTDWERKYVYPAQRTFTYSEIVTPEAGFVEGIDSNARTQASLGSNPPAYSMSGLRLAATEREALRNSPLLLGQLASHRDRVTAVSDITVNGTAYPAVDYKFGDQILTVLFDRQTGLPARLRTLDYDNVWGDVTYDLVLSNWHPIDPNSDKLQVANSRVYELNGKKVAEVELTELKPNVSVPADRVTIPAAQRATAAKPATSKVPYQWVLRRQFIANLMDSDDQSFDTRGLNPGLKLSEVGPGIQQVVGGTHNSLLVEMKDHLIAFDAPVSDQQSAWTLAAAKEKFPGKPVKFLILTHHHMDHTGGLRAYAAAGATLVVGKGNAEHFKKVLAAPFTRDPYLESRDLSKTPIVEVADHQTFGDGTREVTVQLIDNPHAQGFLLGFIPDANLGWVVDLWSPGRDPLPEKLNPNQAAFVAAVEKSGFTPAKFAAGHGSVGDFASLAALEGK
jgi:glyoxylase-like metal-dependent hydrolase (beta-lactamase superfamily II)